MTIRQDGVSLTQISLLANLIPEIDFLDQVKPHAATDPIFYIGEKFQISDGKLYIWGVPSQFEKDKNISAEKALRLH